MSDFYIISPAHVVEYIGDQSLCVVRIVFFMKDEHVCFT